MTIPLHTVKILRENLDLDVYPETHLVWKWFRDPDITEVTLPARSDYNKVTGEEYFIVDSPDKMKFIIRKEYVEVVHNT